MCPMHIHHWPNNLKLVQEHELCVWGEGGGGQRRSWKKMGKKGGEYKTIKQSMQESQEMSPQTIATLLTFSASLTMKGSDTP